MLHFETDKWSYNIVFTVFWTRWLTGKHPAIAVYKTEIIILFWGFFGLQMKTSSLKGQLVSCKPLGNAPLYQKDQHFIFLELFQIKK